MSNPSKYLYERLDQSFLGRFIKKRILDPPKKIFIFYIVIIIIIMILLCIINIMHNHKFGLSAFLAHIFEPTLAFVATLSMAYPLIQNLFGLQGAAEEQYSIEANHSLEEAKALYQKARDNKISPTKNFSALKKADSEWQDALKAYEYIEQFKSDRIIWSSYHVLLAVFSSALLLFITAI